VSEARQKNLPKAVALVALFVVTNDLATLSLLAQTRLSTEQADRLIVEKPEPVYPPLAKQMRLQGTVKADVTVSESGSVSSTKVVSGHPLLVTAALDAVKKYRYTPYLINGKAVSFITTVEVPFSVGIPKKQYDDQQTINEEYFKEADKCQDLRKKQQWGEAEEVCKAAVPLAEQLEEQGLTKMLAYESVGHLLLAQGRFQEALDYYTHAFAFAQVSLKETDAEMGWTYRNLALANHGLGNINKARELYEKAEKTLQIARDNIGMEALKQRYAQGIKEILKYHAAAAEQAGATAEAEELRRRLAAMP
jgi:TonB family protein